MGIWGEWVVLQIFYPQKHLNMNLSSLFGCTANNKYLKNWLSLNPFCEDNKVYRGGMGIWGGMGRFANIFQKRLFDNVKSHIFCWLIYQLKDIYS